MFGAHRRLLVLADAEDDHNLRVIKQREQKKRRAKGLNRLNNITEIEHIQNFRLNKNLTLNLVAELSPHLPQGRRSDSLTPQMKVLIALSFYATGSYQRLVGLSGLHNVSQKTVSRVLKQVTEAINKIFPQFIKWPAQRMQRTAIKAKFFEKFEIPGVVGCIDGTQVAILRPIRHEERYFNRKGFHSLNVMIICDADLNIIWVDALNPGSTHDARVWSSSPICTQLNVINNAGEQVFLLGDSGYPLRCTLMTPILNTVVGTPEHHYYMKHVTARNTVERCIGVLKARFRCLLSARALHYDPTTAGKIVTACCILHNICNSANMPVETLTAEEVNEEAFPVLEAADHGSRRVNLELQAARLVQQSLVHSLWGQR